MRSSRRAIRLLSFQQLTSRIAFDAAAALNAPIIETDTPATQTMAAQTPYIETRGPMVEPVRPIVMGPIISPDDLLIISSMPQKESDLSLPLIPAGGVENNTDGRDLNKSSPHDLSSPQSLREVGDNRYLSLDNGHVSYDLLPQPTAIGFNVKLDETLLPANIDNPRPTLASYATSKSSSSIDELSSQIQIGVIANKPCEEDSEAMSRQLATETDETSLDQNRLTTDDYFSNSGERQRVDWSVDVSASASRGELALDSAGEIVSEILGQKSALPQQTDDDPLPHQPSATGIDREKRKVPPADRQQETYPLSAYLGAAFSGVVMSLLDSERRKERPRCYRFLRSRESGSVHR